jgi:hypothetical protein
MRGKLWSTGALVFLWLVGGRATAETGQLHGPYDVQEAEVKSSSASHNIIPTAAFVGTVPASSFSLCRPPVFSDAQVVLFLIKSSTLDEPAWIVGQARCVRMIQSGATKSQFVPLFFVVFPEKERREGTIEIQSPGDDPAPSQFVPGRMDAGHSIG